jgi:hypothetical protein
VTIDTREELINALHEASEIEHGLMIQYLFGALSLKKNLQEGLTAEQARLVRAWEATILSVARDEMGHLGTVCNLLSAIGAPPRFGRPNFPQATGYYPFAFDLVPFSDDALYRFQVFELPRGAPLPPPPGQMTGPRDDLAEALAVVPDELTYEYVGELYAKIQAGFESIAESELFIGPREAQDEESWSVDLDIRPVRDRQAAIAAIGDIIEDGEGTPVSRAGSHYDRFSRIRLAYAQAADFQAARQVVWNPMTREHRDADGPGALIENEASRRIAEFFNGVYATVLHLLLQYFSYGGETSEQREALKAAAARLMSVAIRPVAEILTTSPFAEDADPRRAGPTFELYADVTLSPFPEARWIMLLERLHAIVAEAAALQETAPRLGGIGETIGFIRRAIASAAEGSAPQ